MLGAAFLPYMATPEAPFSVSVSQWTGNLNFQHWHTLNLWLVSGIAGTLLFPLTLWKLWGWRWRCGSWWWWRPGSSWWWLSGRRSGTGPLGENTPGLCLKKNWSIWGLGEKLVWCWCWWKPLLSVWEDILNCTPGWRFKKTILMSLHHDFLVLKIDPCFSELSCIATQQTVS